MRLRVSTIVSLSLTDFLLRGRSAALARLDAAEAEVDRAAHREADHVDGGALRARIAYQRANIHGRAGDLALAWEHMGTAMARLDAFTDPERCSVLLGRGMLALTRSRPGEAAAVFGDAARLAHEIGSPGQEFMALHNGGYAAYLLGDLPRALSEMARAEQVDAPVSRATARLDRGRVLLEAGLVGEAEEVFRAGAAEYTARGEAQLRADFHLELARALLVLGRPDDAAVAARRARRSYHHLGTRAWEASAHLLSLRAVLQRLEHLERLDDPTAPLSDAARRRRARTAAREADALTLTAQELGDVGLAQSGRTVAAAAFALSGDTTSALARLDAGGGHRPDSLAEALDHVVVASTVLSASGEQARARRLLSRAARDLAAGQRGSASLDLRTARAVLGARLGRLDLELARRRGSGAVLESLERWRSATDRLPLLGRPADEELAGLTEQLRGIRARMREEADGPEGPALQARAARLERQIRARDWMLSNGGDLTADLSVRVRDARDLLADLDRDLLWFFPDRGRLCGLGVSAGRATVRDLMDLAEATELARRLRADLRVAATRQLGPMREAVWASLRHGAARLDDALVQPWAHGDRGLVVVTSPEVAALPWALLPSLSGRAVTVAWSLTAFARRSAQARGVNPSAGASASAEDVGPSRATLHVSVGPDVARGDSEADAVVAAWSGADVARPDTSSSRCLVEALAAPGIVHVAAHGTHVPESPLFSSLVLHDGPMFAHELQPSGVAADHVVLSACDVGTSIVRPGDESLGLAASMLSLGARSVVAAVSPVPDEVAEEVMARHHRLLAQGQASDEALAGAIAGSTPAAAAFLNLGGRW